MQLVRISFLAAEDQVRYETGRVQQRYGPVREPLRGLHGIGGGQLEHDIGAHGQCHFRPGPLRDDGRLAPLKEAAAHYGDGGFGTGLLLGPGEMIDMPMVKRIIFNDYADDAQNEASLGLNDFIRNNIMNCIIYRINML
ncbi:hypothetical protein D3C81_1083850 [compost metagenome]